MAARLRALDRSVAVIAFDLNRTIIEVNEVCARALGYAREEMIGRHHSMLIGTAEPAFAWEHSVWERLGQNGCESGVFKWIAKDGAEVWFQGAYHPISGMDGTTFKIVNCSSVVTEQVHARIKTEGQILAISKAQAVIEFTLDGTIISANKNFLDLMGYALDEIKGQHHSIFIEQAERNEIGYRSFWAKLGRGEYDAGQYKRIAKDGREVWIQGVYNPILDSNGQPASIMKFATDITAQRLKQADSDGQIAAIHKAQAVIEFTLEGKIIDANENFLSIMEYSLSEIQGKHHSIFIDAADQKSFAYAEFWKKLGRGEYEASQFRRISKSGKEIWIQASYNPIFDLSGVPFKVVKYAVDITSQINAAEAMKRAVEETQAVVSAAENNDLSQRIPMLGKTDNISALCGGINALLETTSKIIATIADSCDGLATASREIAMGNTDLSQRTEEQAASLEETSASLEELTSTVRMNSDNAQQANRLASSASDIAVKGGAAVNQVVSTMGTIVHSSRKISDIIGVIDEIAFQTNILALNAAVEAARAGDQGRGFAVVAVEVRNLAQRSANAAKEIKALISDSMEKVDAGSKLVLSAGQTMEDIVKSVQQVKDIMEEISAASREQSGGIEQVNTAVAQMDKITQQNAALVEEAAAAAKSMEEQTEALAAMVVGFVLIEEGGAPRNSKKSAQTSAALSTKVGPKKLPRGRAETNDWSEF